MNYEVAEKEISSKLSAVQTTVSAMVVDSEESLAQVSDILKQVKDHEKDIEAKEKEFTKPLNDTIKKIRDVFLPYKAQAEALKRMIEQEKILPYHRILAEKKRKEEEQRREEEAARLRAEQERKLALASDFENEDMLNEAIKEEEKINRTIAKPIVTGSIKSQNSTTSVTKRWVFEIEDPSQVPYRYCTPDPKLLKEAVDGGLREIPGVKIYEKETVISR